MTVDICELECECEECCPAREQYEDGDFDDAGRAFEEWKAQRDYERAMEMDEFLAGLVESEHVGHTDEF